MELQLLCPSLEVMAALYGAGEEEELMVFYQVFGERRVGQLFLGVDVQFVPERRATWRQAWGGGAARGHSSAGLRRHAVLALARCWGSVSQESHS